VFEKNFPSADGVEIREGKAEKVVSAIPTVPFRSPAFVSADLARLIFCAVVGTIHQAQEVVDNARLFLESALDTLEHAGADFARHRSRLTKLCRSMRHADSLDVLETAERLAGSVGECVRRGFADLLLAQVPGESTQMWCVKAAAICHFTTASFLP
jgi:hypothetical protein